MSFLARIREQHAQRLQELESVPLPIPKPIHRPQALIQNSSQPAFLWIAEVKQASPSRGAIAPKADPVTVARSYINHGADMLSVLTEPHFFNGSLKSLAAIRAACPNTPILMKDFILDTVQIAHGQAAGANAFLLIMALLNDAEFQTLYPFGHQRGLLPLVEVHSEADIDRLEHAVQQQYIPEPLLIGVNHRCLHSLKIDLQRSQVLYPRLRQRFPRARLIAESGLSQAQDILRLQHQGYQGCLVGSAFMSEPDPGRVLQSWQAEIAKTRVLSVLCND